MRQPSARLLYDQMARLRGGLVASGLPVTEDTDDDFLVDRNPT